MGQGSKAYFIYYLVASLVYLCIMAIGFAYTTQYTCNPMCPMLIPVSNEGKAAGLDYSQCLCNASGTILNATGYWQTNPPLPDTPENEQARLLLIQNLTSQGKTCYICASRDSPTVYEPCPEPGVCNVPGLQGFRPAVINSTQVCNTQFTQFPQPMADILVAPAVTNRQMVNVLILVMSILFLIQTVAALVIAYAYFRFKDKYDSDWGRLSTTESTLGILAKLLPNVVRLANLVAMIFLIMGSVYFFSDHVCEFDQNNQGYVVFYPTIYSYLVAMIIVWLFFCFLGGCFHNTYPRDTSFYNPRFPDDPNENCCVRCLCRGWCILTNFGP